VKILLDGLKPDEYDDYVLIRALIHQHLGEEAEVTVERGADSRLTVSVTGKPVFRFWVTKNHHRYLKPISEGDGTHYRSTASLLQPKYQELIEQWTGQRP